MITGGSSGIGEALARRLAAHGWRCVLLARRADRLRAVAAEIGGEFEVCDVASRDQVDDVARRIVARHPRLALLVNNAGIPARSNFLDAEPERIEEVARINYLGSVWCLRAFLPGLLAAPRAHLVNVVSVAGAVSFAPGGPYTASKHAQLAFSRGIAPQLRKLGVRVHTILPGFVETEGFPQRSRLRGRILRSVVIEPEQVAAAVLDAIARDRPEVWVPSWYRAAAVPQALAPGLMARATGRTQR